MIGLTISLLGPPAVALDGRAITFDTRKATALLAFLAERGRPVRRATLSVLLWPEYPSTRAAANLRRTLWSIGHVLGPGWLQATADDVELATGTRVCLDLHRFRALVAHAARQESSGADHDAIPSLVEAAQLVRGAFLEGFSLPDSAEWDDWQALQAAELRRSYAEVLRRLAYGPLASSDLPRALGFAQRWADLDPLDEPALRRLMQLYVLDEQPMEALRRYRATERLLERELGVAPQRETVVLFETIRARRALPGHIRAAPPPTPPGPTPVPDDGPSLHAPPALVGRRDELLRLDEHWRAALGGEGRAVFVIGEAGSGKTALLEAMAHGVGPALVAAGACNAYAGIGDPYLPFRQILEQLIGVRMAGGNGSLPRPGTSNRQALLAAARAVVLEGPDLLETMVPARSLLARVSPLVDWGESWFETLERAAANREARGPVPQQHSLFDQYARVVEALAREQPLVLLVDDLQWSDPSSLNLLLHLGRTLGRQRILLVGAYRPADVAQGRAGERHPLEPVVNELQRVHGQAMLDLDAAAGRRFVDELLDRQPNRLDEHFRRTLHRITGGQALFTVELLRGMRERGDLLADDHGRLVARETLDWNSLPARVEAVIGERIARLAASDRELLRVASAEGEEFGAEVVARVLATDARAVGRRLSSLLDREQRLVRAVGVREHGEARVARFRFRHFLFQRYLHNSLDAAERATIHERIGATLEELYSTDSAPFAVQLAYHYEQAGYAERAVSFLEQAGNHALRLAANDEAIAHFRRALAQLDQLTESTARRSRELELQIGLSQALQLTLGYPAGEVQATLERAMELGRALGNPPPSVALLARSAHMLHTLGAHRKARAVADELMGLALHSEDERLLLEAFTAQGITACLLGEHDTALAELDQALARYTSDQHADLTFTYGIEHSAHLSAYAALSSWLAGQVARSRAYQEQALETARASGHPHTLAFTLAFSALAETLRRDVAATLDLTAEALAVSAEHGFRLMGALALALRGWAVSMAGAPEQGLATVDAALEAARPTRVQMFMPYLHGLLAETQDRLGHNNVARETIEHAIDHGRAISELAFQPALERIRERLHYGEPRSCVNSTT